jgi:hypothetical protein
MYTKFLSEKPEVKRLLGRSTRRLEDTIKIDRNMWSGFIRLTIGTSPELL